MGVIYCDVSQLPQRRPDDVYETDRRSAALGVELVTGRPHRIPDPAGGSGIYGELLRQRFPEAVIDGVEVRDVPRPAAYDGWAAQTPFQEFASSYSAAGGPLYEAIVTNPPFGQLDQFVELAWSLLAPEGQLVFLTQLRYLEGQRRAQRIWGPKAPREILVLTQRPSFQADGKSSPAAFCYVRWEKRIDGRFYPPVLRWAVPGMAGGGKANELPAQVQGSQAMQFAVSQGLEVSLVSSTFPEGEEVGRLDDDAAAGHSAEEVLALAATDPGLLPDDQADEHNEEDEEKILQYEKTPRGLVWYKPTKQGIEPTRLTNFQARIVADVLEDDGVECTRIWEVVGRVNGREIRFPVPAKAFRSMQWVSEQLGAEALVLPGSSHHDHTRTAIQLLSQPIPQRTVYTHLGWRIYGDSWVYLHTGGAIGASGLILAVQVNPPRGLERYCLPDLPGPEALREAIRRALRFLRLAPRRQTWLLFAAAVAAVLAEFLCIDFVVWLYGPTGSRKSTIAALVLCFFGQFDRNHLPANFTSTANSVELTLFAAKDAPVVVDDYAPPLDAKAASEQDNVAHRLLRGIGDTRGRNRATADGKLRGEKAPRALPIVTAELPPPGSQSSEARTLQIEWRPESLDLAELTRAQQEDAPHYAAAMTGYLSWLAPQIETLKLRLPAEIREAAQRFPGEHGRVSDAAAKLYLAVSLFLDFAVSTGAIDAEEKEALLAEASDALAASAERTGQQQADRRPTVLFLENLRALLMQGKGYLAARATGDATVGDPRRWGYAVSGQEGGDTRLVRPHAGAEKLGWVDEEEGLVYLPPPIVHPAVTRYSQRAGVRFPLTQRMLGEHLDREGLLARKTDGRREYRVRVEGKPEWCWAIPVQILFPDTENPENAEND